jgi:ribosomal-protein-alanine N-acetyltransferase
MKLDGPQPTMLTARLLLRPYTPEDATELARCAGMREVARTTLRIPHPYSEAQAREYIATTAPAWNEGKGASFAIIDRASGTLAGGVGLMFDHAHNHAELGYWTAVHAWRKGIATEAATRIVDWAFGDLKLSRLHAHAFGSNPASSRVLEKLGMKHEGTMRRHIIKWGEFEDAVMYGVLVEDWRERKAVSSEL